jgi:xanthine dehydrogenase accessory factor
MKDICQNIITALEEGTVPQVAPEQIACFSAAALEGTPGVTPASLQTILESLTPADIPTFQRALDAIAHNEQAWLGFKVVTDPQIAVTSEDTAVVGMTEQGSKDGQHGIFVATEGKEIVFSREYSKRDRFQMLDITRGPHMHNEQYAGVSWFSVPLFRIDRVFILGAGDVGASTAELAHLVGFETIAVDYDPEYLNLERFPVSQRMLIDSFDNLERYLDAGPDDYICVLSRGHMFDPECLLYGLSCKAGYVGMMGCAEKNERVLELIAQKGFSQDDFKNVLHAPIGLKFGAKTPPELGMCIVAQLIQIRAERRKA